MAKIINFPNPEPKKKSSPEEELLSIKDFQAFNEFIRKYFLSSNNISAIYKDDEIFFSTMINVQKCFEVFRRNNNISGWNLYVDKDSLLIEFSPILKGIS